MNLQSSTIKNHLVLLPLQIIETIAEGNSVICYTYNAHNSTFVRKRSQTRGGGEQSWGWHSKLLTNREKGQLTRVLVAIVHSKQDLDQVSLQTFFSPALPSRGLFQTLVRWLDINAPEAFGIGLEDLFSGYLHPLMLSAT